MSAEEPPRVIKSWAYEGVILSAHNRVVTPAELLLFAQHVQERYPNEKVRLHEFGLRVTQGDHPRVDGGPRLDWKDWDQ